MRVESRLAERKGWELASAAAAEKDGRSSSKKNKRRQKKPPAMPTLVQRLHDTCSEVFAHGRAGVVPSPGDVERICSVLDQMNAGDVGLSPNMRYFRNYGNAGRPPVTYLHVYECGNFSIGIFCLPPTAVIPLHNHPGMTVFSKLLFGSLHIKSYDWAEPESSHVAGPAGSRPAVVKADGALKAPCSVSVLYPAAGGNMHCFTAVTACAVLDVLGPPYDDDEDRHCTYFDDGPRAAADGGAAAAPANGGAYAWLEEREKPEDFVVVGAMYGGPRIVGR